MNTTWQGERPCLLLGKFDGLHLGHQALLAAADAYAPECKKVIFSLASKESIEEDGVIYTEEELAYLAKALGADALIRYPFTEAVRNLQAETFFYEVLVREYHVGAIVVGEDFRFGYQRNGDTDLLRTLCEAAGILLTVVPLYRLEQEKVSSTYVRALVQNGAMEAAAACLGRPYFVLGTVAHGKQNGKRLLQFPTLNLYPGREKCLPPFGVYAVTVELAGERYPGIANVGNNPSIPGSEHNPVSVETFLFSFDRMVYGEKVRVDFYRYIRPQKKFDGIAALRAQIAADVETVKEYFAN